LYHCARDIWEFTHVETYSACTSISAITETQMEIFTTADPSHLFLVAGNLTLISNHMTPQKDGGDLSYIGLIRHLLKGSLA
jgi:hypothetical protein